MAVSSVTGPLLSTAGFQIGTEAAPVTLFDAAGNLTLPAASSTTRGTPGAAGTTTTLFGQKTAVADATPTKLFTITIPNIGAGAGGTVKVTSTTTLAGHIGDSTRTVQYTWSVTRTVGAVAVCTITIVTGATVIATSGAGGAYTITSTLGASSVTGAAGASNSFDIQVTNTGSTATTTTVTFEAACLNNLAGGVTIA